MRICSVQGNAREMLAVAADSLLRRNLLSVIYCNLFICNQLTFVTHQGDGGLLLGMMRCYFYTPIIYIQCKAKILASDILNLARR